MLFFFYQRFCLEKDSAFIFGPHVTRYITYRNFAAVFEAHNRWHRILPFVVAMYLHSAIDPVTEDSVGRSEVNADPLPAAQCRGLLFFHYLVNLAFNRSYHFSPDLVD